MRRALAAIATVLICLLAMASPAVADQKLKGTVSLGLADNSLFAGKVDPLAGQPCSGTRVSDELSDFTKGAVIKVRNDKDKVIAVGALSAGEETDDWRCEFKFAVSVPTSTLYTFQVGHRDALALTAKKLKKTHGQVVLTINV